MILLPSPKKKIFLSSWHATWVTSSDVASNPLIKSNTESGEGYSDILIEIPESLTGIVIEIKYSDNDNLDVSLPECHTANRRKTIYIKTYC